MGVACPLASGGPNAKKLGLALAQIRSRNGTVDGVFYRQCAAEIIAPMVTPFLPAQILNG
jgi:hypothetical protein